MECFFKFLRLILFESEQRNLTRLMMSNHYFTHEYPILSKYICYSDAAIKYFWNYAKFNNNSTHEELCITFLRFLTVQTNCV